MDKPILFSPAMVRALIAGTKTQTRRVAMAADEIARGPWVRVRPPTEDHGWQVGLERFNSWRPVRLTYNVGDRLYVREHWRIARQYDAVRPRDLDPRTMTVLFEAGGSISNETGRWVPSRWPTPDDDRPSWAGRLRVGMHLPRWASRITLDVIGARIERLRDITEADAIAEGVERVDEPAGVYAGSWRFYTAPPSEGAAWSNPRDSYLDLWDAINGPGAAAKDPWVSVTTFRVTMGNIDVLGGRV